MTSGGVSGRRGEAVLEVFVGGSAMWISRYLCPSKIDFWATGYHLYDNIVGFWLQLGLRISHPRVWNEKRHALPATQRDALQDARLFHVT
jgi:hypothetical protein